MSFPHVYVHVPFCARRCSYCDFAIAVRSHVPIDSFIDDVRAELRIRGITRQSEPLTSLYLGGETPSRLGGEGVAALLGALREIFPLAPGAEVTIEANPDDVTAPAVRAWRAAGVNRVSLGVQSFDPAVLAWMHRTHDAPTAHRAAATLRGEGITNWSLDLIYALPPEIERDWRADVESALALGPTHLSAYGLTVEHGTPLARWHQRGAVTGVDEERYAREFTQLHGWLAAAGFEHYEVSNYAQPGMRAVHNSAYWTGAPYLGLGPSAHGLSGGIRRWNARQYADWSKRVGQGTDPEEGRETLSAEQRELETLYLGLRTAYGTEIHPKDAPLVDRWRAEGWADVVGGRIVLTPSGWLRLDALVGALTDHRSHY